MNQPGKRAEGGGQRGPGAEAAETQSWTREKVKCVQSEKEGERG